MLSTAQTKKKQNYLTKINSNTLLSNIFSYISKEKTIKIAQINKKLLSSLNLTIDDYYIDKKYQKIILNSKGNINNIFENVYQLYKKDDFKYKTFAELTLNVINYLKYLYSKKIFKSFKLTINGNNTFMKWTYFLFTIEIIRNIKCGLCLKISSKVSSKYYELIKDAILNLDEVKSVDIHSFKSGDNDNYNQNFIQLFDWTKIKCLNFADMAYMHFHVQENLKNIPKNASFSKFCVNEDKWVNIKKIEKFLHLHASHIENLKIINFSDMNINNFDMFKEFTKLNSLKLIKCQHLSLFNFVLFFKSNLSSFKKLILDNIDETENEVPSFINDNYNDFIKILNNLTHLEKLEINFISTPNTNINEIFKILAIIISINPNLKHLKISTIIKHNTENVESKNLKYFINFDSLNSKTKEKIEKEIKTKTDEFTDLIKAISSLKYLTNLQLIINMNDTMTKNFNNFFNVGNSLRSLEIIHSGNLNMTQLFINHPYLDNINFKLICKESDIKVPYNYEKYRNYKLINYEYEFPRRSWKNIVLNYYPINDSLINTLIRCKKSLKQLILNKTINISDKSNEDIYNILLDISNNNKH